MEQVCFMIVIGVSAILFLIGLLRKKMDIFVNFLLRGLMGLLAIYAVNLVLAQCHIDCSVGLNSCSTLTVGILGLPGFCLLYGITAYQYLK